MTEEKNEQTKKTDGENIAVKEASKEGGAPGAERAGKTVFAGKKKFLRKDRGGRGGKRERGEADEFDQKIIDIARVTRVMAGGKRLRFRVCVALGNKKGKIGVGLGKGADVTMAITKAVNSAKKNMIDAPIVNETIPHEIYQKSGAAKVLLKPAKKGRGIIAGGAVRLILELSGIKNITSKNLGTNNKVNVAKCVMEAMKNIKRVEKKEQMKETAGAEKEASSASKETEKQPVL